MDVAISNKFVFWTALFTCAEQKLHSKNIRAGKGQAHRLRQGTAKLAFISYTDTANVSLCNVLTIPIVLLILNNIRLMLKKINMKINRIMWTANILFRRWRKKWPSVDLLCSGDYSYGQLIKVVES